MMDMRPYDPADQTNTSTRPCSNKARYGTRKDAVTMCNLRTRGRRQMRHNRPEFLRVYHCPHCNGWHLTKKGGGTSER